MDRRSTLSAPLFFRCIYSEPAGVEKVRVECAFLDQRGGVGTRIKPAAAIVRAYGKQFRTPALAGIPTDTEAGVAQGKDADAALGRKAGQGRRPLRPHRA